MKRAKWMSPEEEEAYIRGACQSIEKTLDEVARILEGRFLPPEGGLRERVRGAVQDALVGEAKRWYKRGFKRGHIESYVRFKLDGKVPRRLRKAVDRELLPRLERRIKLRSSISDRVDARIKRSQ